MSNGASTGPVRAPRLAGLDGLRAVAVLAVMAFHFGFGWMQGGFLGVDVFYVLSGYLITSLLLAEYGRRDRIGLGAFWMRRARRLLPCLFIVLLAVTVYVRYVALPGTYPNYRMSALSALFYFSNWFQIGASSNYFVTTGAVSPLTHTWSLAIEEQFYLIWPLVVLAVIKLSGNLTRAVKVLLAISLVGAAASALEMAVLYNPNVNTTRLYFGTDTHAQCILVGAALACVMTLVQRRRGATELAPVARGLAARTVLVVLGCVGMGVLVALSHFLSGTSAVTYQGGFLLTALASGAVIAGAVSVPTGALARLLSVPPLVALGTISYGAYLWHFPIGVYLSPARTGMSGAGLAGVRFVATVVVAAASYYLVERPIIRGTFWRSLKALVPAGLATGAVAGVIFVATAVPATAATQVTRFDAHDPPNGVSLRALPPHRLVVLGDSTALTLAYALSSTAPSGTKVVNGGLFGCGLAIATDSSNYPPTPGLPMAPRCNSSTPPSQQWPAVDERALVGTGRGDVVLFLAGHWETTSMLLDGHWTDIRSRAFQAYEENQMRKVVDISTAHGAHLDFLTMACMDGALAIGSPPYPGDSAHRRAIYNGLLRKVAAEYPSRVSVIDFGSIVCPSGAFTLSVGGVQVRTPDGVHTPSYVPGNEFAGNATQGVADSFYDWVSPRIWPLIIDTGRSAAH